MVARLLCVMLITGCYEVHRPAERPRFLVYNSLELAGGLALGGLGYAVAADQYNSDSDGVGGFAGLMMATGGAVLAMCGLGGLLENWLYAPAR